MKKINVLSGFDGMSCGLEALKRNGIQVENYYASEVDKYAIQIAQKNHPEIKHVGDIRNVSANDLPVLDLVIGGSPCQDLSVAKNGGKGLAGEKSGLFFEFVRVAKEAKEKNEEIKFLLENVASMRKEDRDEITRILLEIFPDTECILINSALVAAQNRKRLYWTNIKGITQPQDKEIYLKDILEDIPFDDPKWKPLDDKYVVNLKQSNNCLFEVNSAGKLRQGYEYFTPDAKVGSLTVAHGDNRRIIVKNKSYGVTATYAGAVPRDDLEKSNRTVVVGQFRRTTLRIHADQEKVCTLTSNMGTGGNNVPILIDQQFVWRKLTCIECERLQTLQDGYTEGVSNTQRYKMIGNGWTVDVIKHILSFLDL